MTKMSSSKAYRPPLPATYLVLASLLAILGTVPGHGAEESRPGIADRCPGTNCAAPPARGVTVYRGLVLDYEVIDGMAVHDGDMVLGTAAEAAAAAPSREPAELEGSEGPARRDISGVTPSSSLWPGGRVPYEIDDDVEGTMRESIQAAIEEWNSKTVISLFPRTDEGSYVRFRMVSSGNCRAGVGYLPNSATNIWLQPRCDTGSVIHEIGHAVGLLHEHQRPDRDRFIAVPIEATRREWTLPGAWVSHAGDLSTGPYDYRSVMHYWPGTGVLSIPPGVPIARTGGLSEGDIDGVARLYGKPPGAVTVATNPPGLQLIVDGDTVTAPATFDWLPGSVHTLEAPLVNDRDSPQYVFDRDGRPYVFGSWSDGGDRERTITVDVADSTWLEANYIRSVRVEIAASPADAGTFALAPESPDGWYPKDSRVDATLIPAGGRRVFARYRLGNSSGSVRLVGEQSARIISRADIRIEALYRTPPLYHIDSKPEGLGFQVNAPWGVNQWRTPAAFQPSELPAGTTVSVPEFPEYRAYAHWETAARGGRYRFSGWSDGGEREHEIEVPAGGGSLTLQVQREFQLVADVCCSRPPGKIVVAPESEDGFHPVGTRVQLTAVPEAGRYFVGWEHDLAGTETTRSVIMDRDRLAGALFSYAEPVLVPFGEPLPAASLTGRHFVRVPDGTSEVAVRFESSANVRDAAFHVTGGDGYRELGATRLRESGTITLTRETLSRMRDARLNPSYRSSHHLLIRQRGGSAWSGTLHVSIQRDWIGGVWPPAFTFVSAAGWSRPLRQTLRVTPVEGEIPPVRYRIVSDSHWLEAFPPEWTGAQGAAEIAVTANGAALGPEAYGGKLKILILRDGEAAEGWTPTGIEIPVHFVVKPADGAKEPTGDGSSGLAGGDDHGDTREAATELAAGAAARGHLERVGDEDWFRFRTTAAQTWITAYTESEGDTTGELHVAGSGSPLADDDSGSGGNFRIATSVPAGTHYVRVRGFGTADYALTLEAVPDDHGDTRELSTEIAVGGSARGRIDVAGDEDWFRFRTTAAQTWITAYTVSEGYTAGELHVAGGGTVAGDYWGSGANFRITASVPAGMHYVRVSGSGTADYTLALQETLDAMEFVRIPAGTFVMGSPEGEADRGYDEGQREVQISQAFWMGKYEVTEAEWLAATGESTNRWQYRHYPVGRKTWEDVQEFIRKLNERQSGSGYVYRLPTEAEWEYAARAGATGARYGELDEIAWWYGNYGQRYRNPNRVGLKRANAWGLHDMLGNVAEWTGDWYGPYPSGFAFDPRGPATGSKRVSRGGSVRSGYYDPPRFAARGSAPPSHGSWWVGFRLVRTQAGGPSGDAAEDDHGDAPEAATEVAVGDSAQGRIERLGDEDWFRFRTTAARTGVTARAVSEGMTAVEVHAAGASLADGDSGGGGRALSSRSTASVPAGTHYVRVRGLGTLDYTLTLQEPLAAMEFVRIPAGTFVMGSPEDEEDRTHHEGQHEVTLSQGFWMGKHEVTQEEWEAAMGENPSEFKDCGARCPVENVSWEDAQEFIRRLNERESAAGSSARYRLPTEAEWEYAARAGTTGARHGELGEIAWYEDNSGGTTHPVGEKRANAWGLHDMLGNVLEWTSSWWGRYPSGAVTDPPGSSTRDAGLVFRGGSYYNGARFVRSADRGSYYNSPGLRSGNLGFRLVRTD